MHVGDVLYDWQGRAEVDWEEVLLLPVCQFGDAEEGSGHQGEVEQVQEGLADFLGEILAH